jgi:hypothetical protein
VNDNSFYIDHSTPQSVTSGNNAVAAVTIPIKYARIRVQASSSANVAAYYNGRA